MDNGDWQTIKLGKAAELVMGQSPDSRFYNGAGEGLKFLQGCAEFGKKYPSAEIYCTQPKKVAPPNSILLSVRAPVGMINLADQQYCIGRGLAAIIPQSVEIDYLYQYLLFKGADWRNISQGSTFQAVNSQQLNEFDIFLPVSCSEQSAIAAVLSCIDRVIELTEALIAKQQRLKAGLMQRLLTKGIDENGKLRSEATHEFKDSPLGRIPVEWDVVKVEYVGAVRLGRQRSPKHQSGRFTTPYLRVANVFDGWIDYSDILSMDFTPAEKEIYNLLPGDILLNEGPSLELVGRSAIYEGEAGQYCFQNTLVRFRSFPGNVAGFCQAVFKYWQDTGRFMDVARQTTSVAHLGANRFAQMDFALPQPEEQQRICSVLNAQYQIIKSQQAYLQKLRRLKTGLMQNLLTGEVRVTSLLETQSRTDG